MQATDKQKKKARLPRYPKGHLIAAGALSAMLPLVFLLFPSSQAVATRHSTIEVDLELQETQQIVESHATDHLTIEPEPEHQFQDQVVRNGDNLSLIFKRAGLTDRDMYELIANDGAKQSLRRIYPGQTLGFSLDAEGKLAALKYTTSALSHELYKRTEQGFEASVIERQPDLVTAFRHAEINSSLFLAGQEAGLEPSLIMELANIFGWDIDFALDIREGDSFSLVYQERFLDGEKFDNGNILAAEFINQGKRFRAVRYVDEAGNAHFYTPEGESMRKAFLRTPLDFARISSHFNLKRKHPVLHTIRAHKGTDYAAATGTPIRATGDGKVIHASRKGGYGNAIIIQHGQTYRTLYAHLSKYAKGVKSGARVRQGQVIGYVGATGLASGPHLHYEFYVNGAVRNPVTVPLPQAESVAKSELPRFFAQTATALAALDDYQKTTQVAGR